MTTLEEIVSWASVLTAENRERLRKKHYYHVTKPVKMLEWKLTHVNNQLIALIGLQGTGKTSALNYLAGVFWKVDKNVVVIKWTKNWFNNLYNTDDVIMKHVNDRLIDQIKEELETYGLNRKRHPFLRRVPDRDDLSDSGISRIISHVNLDYGKIIGKGKVKELTNECVWWFLEFRCPVIFIDLPDYRKTDRRSMANDLAAVQDLWERVGKDKNIVIAVQKELFGGHFFFGKMDTIELQPLKPEELMRVFKTQFPDCALITDDALILLGQLSRGVFRRFLKYLNATLVESATSGEDYPVTPEHVNKAVTIDQLIKDMELELSDLFRSEYQARQAVELLYYLREKGAANQKDIAEFLNVSMVTAGKIVNKMYRYVKKERGKGKEWIVSLKV